MTHVLYVFLNRNAKSAMINIIWKLQASFVNLVMKIIVAYVKTQLIVFHVSHNII